jgi:hypothetical protein
MSTSTGVRTANYACGALAYVWFPLCWFLALIPGYLTWLFLALAWEGVGSGRSLGSVVDALGVDGVLLVAGLGNLALALLIWPFAYLWLYDRWQVRKGL